MKFVSEVQVREVAKKKISHSHRCRSKDNVLEDKVEGNGNKEEEKNGDEIKLFCRYNETFSQCIIFNKANRSKTPLTLLRDGRLYDIGYE